MRKKKRNKKKIFMQHNYNENMQGHSLYQQTIPTNGFYKQQMQQIEFVIALNKSFLFFIIISF